MNAPGHLSDAAKAVWGEVAADMLRRKATPAAVEAYCLLVARMRDAAARVDREGLIVSDEKGRPVPHPALAVEKACQAELRQWARR